MTPFPTLQPYFGTANPAGHPHKVLTENTAPASASGGGMAFGKSLLQWHQLGTLAAIFFCPCLAFHCFCSSELLSTTATEQMKPRHCSWVTPFSEEVTYKINCTSWICSCSSHLLPMRVFHPLLSCNFQVSCWNDPWLTEISFANLKYLWCLQSHSVGSRALFSEEIIKFHNLICSTEVKNSSDVLAHS